jgi:hypothetical protein
MVSLPAIFLTSKNHYGYMQRLSTTTTVTKRADHEQTNERQKERSSIMRLSKKRGTYPT